MNQEELRQRWENAFRLYKEGNSPWRISKALGIEKREILHRCYEYEQTGVFRTGPKKATIVTGAMKCCAIRDRIKNSLSLKQTAVKYDICLSTLKKWLKIYRLGGYGALRTTAPRPKRRPEKMSKPKNQASEAELKSLRERLEYLEAENAYLKKLHALRQEENAEKFGVGPRQSGI